MYISAKYSSWGIALLRIAVGVVFLVHGYQKLFVYGMGGATQGFAHMGIPLATVVAPLVTLVEFFGGIALILGIATRAFALLLAIDMLGAILTVHGKHGFFLPTGFEYAFTLMIANVGLVLTGAGAAAIDNLLGRKKGEVVAENVGRAA
jgi:putative oxidoreductase